MLADRALKLVFRDIGTFYDDLLAHHYRRGRRKIQVEILIGQILLFWLRDDFYFNLIR